MSLEVNTYIKIQKPAEEVFEAILDPKKMSKYFITTGSARLEEGKSVIWTWADFNDAKAQVEVLKIEKDRLISFRWPASKTKTDVDITLEPNGERETLVRVREHGWKKDDDGIAAALENTQGWANFLDCLKAYLEYGINLRQAAF